MRKFTDYFDGLFCLSLPSSLDRRHYMTRQFRRLGIDRYEFFDATDKDDPAVTSLYDSGKVARYPPCFRCGELACGRDDCNNVLIPAQVATFISFSNLWRHILDTGIETALIVEDDVAFLDYAPRVADAIIQAGMLDLLGIRGNSPVLLRLGWAASADHRATGQIGFKPNLIKMSNPCHALNRAMVSKLLNSFDRVDYTADRFIHKEIGPTAANFTLFPPLASELSWSVGSVKSLIHPKSVHVDYLRRNYPDRKEEIEDAIRALRNHQDHIFYRDLLAIGHPCCGASRMSKVLQSLGLDVGHDRIGERGISSWKFAVEEACAPLAGRDRSASRKATHFGAVVQFVRDPRQAIPSIIRENRHAEKSYAFRRKHILSSFGVDLDAAQSEVERALLSYVYWNKIIERQPVDLRIRVEEAEAATRAFLEERNWLRPEAGAGSPPPKDINAPKLYKGTLPERPDLSSEDWDSISDTAKSEANEMCRRYGYQDLYEHG
jgi:hypothetical protein